MIFGTTLKHLKVVGAFLGTQILGFLEVRGGDLIMLSVTLFGTYKISKMAIDRLFPKPTLDDATRGFIVKILDERPLQNELTEEEEYLANNVILPSMINVTFDDIGGLDNIKEEIEQMIVLPFQRPELFTNPLLSIPRGILLHGPPGTGKTMLAKAIAKQSKAVFINFRQDQIFQKYVGESEKMINGIFSLALKLQPAIIFIDEADSFFGTRSHEHEIFARLQCNLLALMDGLTTSKNDQVMVLACTNRPETLDPAFLRRMQRKFNVGLPNEAERVRILRLKLVRDYVEPGFDYNALAAKTEYFSGSDLEILCRTAAQYSLREAARAGLTSHSQMRKITMHDCNLALSVTTPTTLPIYKKRDAPQQQADFGMVMQMLQALLDNNNNNNVNNNNTDGT